MLYSTKCHLIFTLLLKRVYLLSRLILQLFYDKTNTEKYYLSRE